MAEKKYKVENKLHFQSTATNVDTSDKYTLMNVKWTGHWNTLVLNRNNSDFHCVTLFEWSPLQEMNKMSPTLPSNISANTGSFSKPKAYSCR